MSTLPSVPASSSHAQTVTEEEILSTEEENTQISQMDKEQVSETYTYLKEEFSDGVYYLNYVKEAPDRPSEEKREYILASDGISLYIRDLFMGYTYLKQGGTLIVMDDKNKTAERFILMEGSEFSYTNYVDWFDWTDYEKIEFTSESAGTKSRPKLTESFVIDGKTVSFYYYRDKLSTVSGTDGEQNQWLHTIKSLHGEPKGELFTVPSKYTEKKTETT